MHIYLLRHGDASSDSRFQDSERPLTERGEHQANIVGKYLQQQYAEINIILHSPLKRAMQTAAIANARISSPKIMANEYLVNGTDQRQLVKYLNSLNVSSIMLVGHIPHLSETISLLVNGNYDYEVGMKKCSLAIVDTVKPIIPGNAKLKQLIHVDEIEKLIKF